MTPHGGPGYLGLLAALERARAAGIVLGLDRVRAVLADLGSPERRLGAVVHVAGTNGKGSTARFVEAMARAAGLRTALTTSPHLARFTERIEVAGAEVDPEVLAARHAVLRARAPGLDALTFFELGVVLAFATFAEAAPDVTVVEVGLGGRLDATSVVDPAVALVTGVALDHVAVLGGTLEAIAREKAGIWKRGRPAVIGAAGEPEARAWLGAAAAAVGAAPVVFVRGDEADGAPAIALAGAHQRANAAAAWVALDQLEAHGGPRVGGEARLRGLATARWPARLERIATAPEVLLDVAHNPAAARALAAALGPQPYVLVVGIAADKDARGVLAALAPGARAIVATQPVGPRALSAAALAALAREVAAELARGITVAVEPELEAALALGRSLAGADGRVVVCGSFLVVGPLRARSLGEPEDPIAISDPPARA